MRHEVLAILIIAALMPLNDALKCHQCFEVFDDEGKRLATTEDIMKRFGPIMTTIQGLQGNPEGHLTDPSSGVSATTVAHGETSTEGKTAKKLNSQPPFTKRSFGDFIQTFVPNNVQMCPETLESGGEGAKESGGDAVNKTARSDIAAGTECTKCFKGKAHIAGLDIIERSCLTPERSENCNKISEVLKTAFPSGINYLECAECEKDNCNSATSLTTGFFVMCAALATFWF